jgi:hypothetical protein
MNTKISQNIENQVVTEQNRFTITQTEYKETAGMQKGFFRIRNLIKLYDNGVLVKEFTNQQMNVMVLIFMNDSTNEICDTKVCTNENSIKTAWFWSLRKTRKLKLILINKF